MSPQLPAPVSQLIEAVNSGDTEGFLRTFRDAAVVDDWGRTFSGLADIRRWSDAELIGRQVHISILDIDRIHDRTVVVSEVRSTGFNGPTTFTFTSTDGAVSEMRIRA